MLTILGYIILTLAVAIGLILALATTRPDTFRVTRSQRVAASPDRLFPLINDLRVMNTWNPFALRDPSAAGTYSTPSHGQGAIHTFAGPKSGTGHIKIIDATEPHTLVMQLFMTKPFKADNTIAFTLAAIDATSTTVTWTMSGKQPLIGKAITLFVDCDKMVGKDFEKGLAQLKTIAEAMPDASRPRV
jgi:hypothetical protein